MEVDFTLHLALESLLEELKTSISERKRLLEGYTSEPPSVPMQFIGRPITDVNRTVSAPAQAIVALMEASDQAFLRVEGKLR